ncbi:ATP-binding protein [Streptomyces sp. NPDC048415]|jgi:anti-sigma regulatory factor (Ser/Thr protein kinase)|uniref:ATP-binding protein n=1 Tax=Streptomyces sp. NPDC048415 TaxID=3154822 RepID=UPI0034327B2E
MRAERGTPSTEIQMCSPGPSSPVEVRQAVRRALEGRARGRDTADDDEAVSDALLVASELTTNAMLHGGGVTDFEVTPTDGEVRLSVSDRSDDLPVETPRTDDIGRIRVGGNGWMIVCRLASDIVISKLRAGGKRITAVVPLSPRTTG